MHIPVPCITSRPVKSASATPCCCLLTLCAYLFYSDNRQHIGPSTINGWHWPAGLITSLQPILTDSIASHSRKFQPKSKIKKGPIGGDPLETSNNVSPLTLTQLNSSRFLHSESPTE